LGFTVVVVPLVVLVACVACTRALGLGVVNACVSCARQSKRIAACHMIRKWVKCFILNVIADNCAQQLNLSMFFSELPIELY